MSGYSQLGVFAKHWQPGRVKTRLAATVGEASAAALAKQFLQTTLDRFADTADHCVLAYSPDNAGEAMAALAGPRWRVEPQAHGDLGERMHAYFSAAFAAGAARVVLIGSDSPNLPLQAVGTAFEHLEGADVVLGPSEDGGYYLIGAKASPPPVFHGMPWSSPDLWEATTRRLESRGIAYRPLPAWYDVDTIEELRRLQRDLAAGAADPPLAALAGHVDRLLAGE